MKVFLFVIILFVYALIAVGQSDAQKIYDTERAFEKMVAEKGINAGFVEFLSPLSVMFFPEAANGRETWKSKPASPAALTWNPIWIDVASNGAIAYSVGNSVYRPKGKDDPNMFFGHYISVWSRQQDGSYKAALDTGINHEKPATTSTEWRSPPDIGQEKNEGRLSGADSSTGFYEMADKIGSIKAYKTYLADDAILMRENKQPFFGKKAALGFLEEQQPRVKFAKRKAFIEAADMAYVYNVYSLVDKAGSEIERGNFVQVWKLRKGKWLIVADVWITIPKKTS
jgi:ketosteroid isomerase-like protein